MGKTVQANDVDFNPPIVYEPTHKHNELMRYKHFVEAKYKMDLFSYWELQEWTFTNFPEFWDAVWRFYDIKYSQPYTEVFDRKNSFDSSEWFKGVRFNYAENIFKHRDLHTAVIATDDNDNTTYVTYKDLYNEVRLYVRELKEFGIQKGDVVACYMPNKIEGVYAFLATASVGATWCGIQPIMGAKGTLARLQPIKPKILFTAGNFSFLNTEYKMFEKLPEIVEGLPSLQKVVFVPSKEEGKIEDITGIPKCVFASDFLERARKTLQYDSSEIAFEQVPFEHPLCISYTAGSAGVPRGLIHSAGMFLGALKDFGLQQDCTRDDILFNFGLGAGYLWHQFINGLHLGLAVVMYEGDIFEKSTSRYWDIVDKFGVTSSCIESGTLEIMERKGHIPTASHSLKTLRQLFPVGSPVKTRSVAFLSEKVKPNIFCSPLYGSPEMFSSLTGLDCNYPNHRGEMQMLSLGMDVRILDEEGRPVLGKRGDVVLRNPYPACTIGIVNDENKELMRKSYLSQRPGCWNIGDQALLNPVTQGLVVFGTCDEIMSPQGVRFNSDEIDVALEGFPGLMDSICVFQFKTNLEERSVLFVKMNPGYSLTPVVEQEIRKTIEQHLTYEYVPSVIVEAPDIPYNLSGKKVHSLVKDLINKKPVSNEETLSNPVSAGFYKSVDLGDF